MLIQPLAKLAIMAASGWSDWVQSWLPLVVAAVSLLISMATAARSVGRDRRAYAEHVFIEIESWRIGWERSDDGPKVLADSHLRYEIHNDSSLPVEDAVVILWPWEWRSASARLDSDSYWPISPHSHTENGSLNITQLPPPSSPWLLPPLEVVFTVAGRRWRRTPDAQLHWWCGWPVKRWIRCWPHVNAHQAREWESDRLRKARTKRASQ